MANCDLSIELVDGDRPVRGGERVRGTVTVRPDGDFHCKGLEISTRWETHGRGNIASGDVEKIVAFEGQWMAGQTYRYDFELTSGTWPPTYHGESLNVDHVVRATARLPWKSDPTVAHPFRVYVNTAPESGAPPSDAKPAGPVMKVFLTIFFGAIGLFFLLNPVFWCIGAAVGLFGGGWWFVRRWMPSRKLGQVGFTVANPRLCPGETVHGELVITPRKNTTINSIVLHLTAKEVCASGSGSNRTTHTEVVYEDRLTVMEAGELRGGEEHRLPIEAKLPLRPIYSMDLDDNDVVWEADVRIDIPRWPDWRTQARISVVPPAEPAKAVALLPAGEGEDLHGELSQDEDLQGVLAREKDERWADTASQSVDAPGISFQETAALVWENREQPEMVEQVTAAVHGLSMQASLRIDRKCLYREADESVFPAAPGTIFFARCEEPAVPALLYVPGESLARVAEIERERSWTGQAQIVGYDAQQGRLLVQGHE